MTQGETGPAGTGRVQVAMIGVSRPVAVTRHVFGPTWRMAGCDANLRLAQALTTIAGLISHGWWPFSTATCAAQYWCQLVMSQMPGNLGSRECATSMTTRPGFASVQTCTLVRPLKPTPKLRYPRSPRLR